MPVRGTATSRRLTLAAIAILALDGVALLAAGVWTRRGALMAGGVLLLLASAGVARYWRWHRRQLAEIAEARRALRDETRALRDLVSGG